MGGVLDGEECFLQQLYLLRKLSLKKPYNAVTSTEYNMTVLEMTKDEPTVKQQKPPKSFCSKN